MQHDHHCVVTVHGSNCRIRKVEPGLRLIVGVPCPCGCGRDFAMAVVQLTPEKLADFCKAAVEWDYAMARSTYSPTGGRA